MSHLLCNLPRFHLGLGPRSVGLPPPDVMEQLLIDLIALIPGGARHILRFRIRHGLPEEVFFMMPNIRVLRLVGAELSEGCLQPNPDGPHANTKLLPFLRSLFLEDVNLNDGDRGPLTTYLVYQTSDSQIIRLEVIGDFPYTDPGVVDEVKGLVEEFSITVPANRYLSSRDRPRRPKLAGMNFTVLLQLGLPLFRDSHDLHIHVVPVSGPTSA